MENIRNSTQTMGGIIVYIDTENACNEDFLRAIGVNVKDMLYIQLDTVEDIFEVIVLFDLGFLFGVLVSVHYSFMTLLCYSTRPFLIKILIKMYLFAKFY